MGFSGAWRRRVATDHVLADQCDQTKPVRDLRPQAVPLDIGAGFCPAAANLRNLALALRGGGLYWLVVAIVVSFVAALLDAWVLLIEIQR